MCRLCKLSWNPYVVKPWTLHNPLTQPYKGFELLTSKTPVQQGLHIYTAYLHSPTVTTKKPTDFVSVG